MRVDYNHELDTMYISFSDGEKQKQVRINDNLTLDLADDDTLIGMDISNAEKTYGNNVLEFSLSLLGNKLINPDKLSYTADEAAHVLRVNKETVLRKIRGGEIQAFRLGKSYQIPKSEIVRVTRI